MLRLHSTEAVQVSPVALLVQELLSVLLSVDVQQGRPDAPKLCYGDGPSAHPADVSALGGDLPLKEELPLLRGEAVLGEDLQVLRFGENSADEGFRRPGTDDVPAGAVAQDSAQGVDDDALARAGLAGQGVKAPVKGDVRLLNDGDVLDVQKRKHGSVPFISPSPPAPTR